MFKTLLISEITLSEIINILIIAKVYKYKFKDVYY